MEDLEDIALGLGDVRHCQHAGLVTRHQSGAPELTSDDQLDGFLPEAYSIWVRAHGDEIGCSSSSLQE